MRVVFHRRCIYLIEGVGASHGLRAATGAGSLLRLTGVDSYMDNPR